MEIALTCAIAATSRRIRIKNLLDCVTLKSQKSLMTTHYFLQIVPLQIVPFYLYFVLFIFIFLNLHVSSKAAWYHLC